MGGIIPPLFDAFDISVDITHQMCYVFFMEQHISHLSRSLQRHFQIAHNEFMHHDSGIRTSNIVAMIIHKNKMISIGYNSKKSHPLQARFQKNSEAIFIHAEIDAIRKASSILTPKQFRSSTMILMRVKKDGSWGISKPCVHKNGQGCQAAITAFGIGKVLYSTNETGYVGML